MINIIKGNEGLKKKNSIIIKSIFEGMDINLPLNKQHYEFEKITIFRARAEDECDIMVIGLGDKSKISSYKILRASGVAGRILRSEKYTNIFLEDCLLKDNLFEYLEGISLGYYKYLEFKGNDNEKLDLTINVDDFIWNKEIVKKAQIYSEGVYFTRDLVNTPSNKLYPKNFCEITQKRFENSQIQVQVYEGDLLEKEEFFGLMAVAKGSRKPPAYIKLNYARNPKKPLIAFIGKGITFDMGGMNIKTGKNTSSMRMDMGGAGAVVGAFDIIKSLDLDINLIGLIPLAENLPGGNAMLPGDVIKYVDGTTVEVGNTDAEGRLILADAILHAKRLNANVIIDLATLTGSVENALGTKIAGVWGDEDLCNELYLIGENNGEHIWKMPLEDDYKSEIKGEYADLNNIPSLTNAGCIKAALFLKHFVKSDVCWAHIDMAGTVSSKKHFAFNPTGATGFGARLLADYAVQFSKRKI